MAEAIKKRSTNEGYPNEIRFSFATLIWNWINSPTLQDLEDRRNKLLVKLRLKAHDYFLGYYQPVSVAFHKICTQMEMMQMESEQEASNAATFLELWIEICLQWLEL